MHDKQKLQTPNIYFIIKFFRRPLNVSIQYSSITQNIIDSKDHDVIFKFQGHF